MVRAHESDEEMRKAPGKLEETGEGGGRAGPQTVLKEEQASAGSTRDKGLPLPPEKKRSTAQL